MPRIDPSNPAVIVIREIVLGEPPPKTPAHPVREERPLNLQNYVIRYQGQELQVPSPAITFSREDRDSYVLPDPATVRIGRIRFFTRLHRILDLLAEHPLGAAVQYESRGRPLPVFPSGFPFVHLHGGSGVLKVDGDRIEFEVIEPVASRGGYRLQAFAGSDLRFRPDPAIEQALFRIGMRFLAHGTGRGGFMNLFSIAAEGKIVPSSWRGVFYGGLVRTNTVFAPSSDAGVHGPFYVVLQGNIPSGRDPVPRQNHRAYLVTDMGTKRLFIGGVRELHELGIIDRETAIEIINKVYTYEEFIEEANAGRKKEMVKHYAGLPPLSELFDMWKEVFRAGAAFVKNIFKRRDATSIDSFSVANERANYYRPPNVYAPVAPSMNMNLTVVPLQVLGAAQFVAWPVPLQAPPLMP